MKNYTFLGIALFALATTVQADTSRCNEKEKDIRREISYAEKHHNESRINGLKKALSEIQKNCNDEHLIDEKRQKVAERKRELAQARQDGSPEKIAKKQQQLQEAEQELKALHASH